MLSDLLKRYELEEVVCGEAITIFLRGSPLIYFTPNELIVHYSYTHGYKRVFIISRTV